MPFCDNPFQHCGRPKLGTDKHLEGAPSLEVVPTAEVSAEPDFALKRDRQRDSQSHTFSSTPAVIRLSIHPTPFIINEIQAPRESWSQVPNRSLSSARELDGDVSPSRGSLPLGICLI